MADVQVSAPVKLDPAIVRAVARDSELRSLRPGSAEYKAAFEKKFPSKTDSQQSASATESTEKVEEKKIEGTGADPATSTEEERTELSKKAQRRFDKMTAENASLKARISELEKAGATPKQAEKQATAEVKQESSSVKFDKPKPKAGDFKGENALEDYTEAMADWSADKREFEREQKTKAKSAEETRTTKVSKFYEDGKKLAAEMGLGEEDFKALVDDDGVKAFGTTRSAIIESPFAAHIALELANADDATKERISKMSEVQQVAYIGKLEAKFEAKAEAKAATGTTKISAAKAPGKSLQKGTSGGSKAYAPGMDFKSYEQLRKEQRPDKFKR
jgi:hypothetical protein